MQFIIDILIAILMGYLAITNYLAVGIASLLGQELPGQADTESITDTVEDSDTSLTPLSSVFGLIPDILKNNSDYQKATLIEGIENTAVTVIDPLLSIVNIYCTFTTEKTIRTTTGTGFFVSNQGVILTNAHVAQFLLLDDTEALGDSVCTVRNGSPASPRYTAELLYIPPAWVAEHATLIDAKNPSGTGERDYALLFVNDTINGEPLPETFPALALATEELSLQQVSESVITAGYPAGAPKIDTDNGLLARKATTSITELFTFGNNKADVVALKGSAMGEQGSSGGPVINKDGRVIGMIATRGNDEKDGVGSLRGITIDHINRTITEETNVSLNTHLQGNIKTRADIFTTTLAPFLTTLLTNEID